MKKLKKFNLGQWQGTWWDCNYTCHKKFTFVLLQHSWKQQQQFCDRLFPDKIFPLVKVYNPLLGQGLEHILGYLQSWSCLQMTQKNKPGVQPSVMLHEKKSENYWGITKHHCAPWYLNFSSTEWCFSFHHSFFESCVRSDATPKGEHYNTIGKLYICFNN